MKRGEREAMPEKTQKAEKPPVKLRRGNIFADLIVLICIGMGALVTGAAIWEYHRLDTPMPASVITALMGMWGGELLILAARQILGSDALPWSRKPASSADDVEDGVGI